MQPQKIFFDNDNKPSSEEIENHLEHPDCPLNKIIVSEKNEGNMEILKMFAHTAYSLPNHSCRGMSFVILSTAGQGKTYVVRQWAATIGIPFVFVQSDALADNHHLFNLIQKAFESTTPIIEQPADKYTVPPCIVFLDEIHALPNRVMDGLLNAMEYNDGKMKITVGKGLRSRSIEVDCREVCWVGATTEEGKLPGPFASRLETTIIWHPAGPEEICDIVNLQYPELSDEACWAVAKYRTVPRGAVAFARLMIMAKNRDQCTWEEAADTIAKNMDLDEYGMPNRQVELLTLLGHRPISKSVLAIALKCNLEALERVILPPLLQTGLVIPTRRGYAITKAGICELDKRNILHKGEKITVEYIERKA